MSKKYKLTKCPGQEPGFLLKYLKRIPGAHTSIGDEWHTLSRSNISQLGTCGYPGTSYYGEMLFGDSTDEFYGKFVNGTEFARIYRGVKIATKLFRFTRS